MAKVATIVAIIKPNRRLFRGVIIFPFLIGTARSKLALRLSFWSKSSLRAFLNPETATK
jgi:hypothetical protein